MEEQENQPTSNKISPALWVSIVLIIIVLAGGAYYISIQDDTNTNNSNIVVNINTAVNENVNTVVNSNIPTNTSSTVDTNVDTSDWKTYTNSEYEYTLQYPDDWTVEEKKLTEDPLGSDRTPPFRAIYLRSPDQQYSLNISIKNISDEGSTLLGGGIGVSDTMIDQDVIVANKSVGVTKGKVDDRVTVLLFPIGGGTIQIDNFEFGAQFGSGPGMSIEVNENFNLLGSVEENIVYQILASLNLP